VATEGHPYNDVMGIIGLGSIC